MNILVCAYSCDPEGGSERHVGWAGVRVLARTHRVTVISHGWGREATEAALREIPEGKNLRFHFIGGRHTWHPNRLIARFQDWRRLAWWTREAAALARRLVAEEKFDLAHHVTIATWRSPSPLGGLGVPLVWGPVGGGEAMPQGFYGILSPTARVFEAMRAAANWSGLRSRKLRAFAQTVSVALGNNRETLAALRSLGIPDTRVRYLSQSFLGPEKFDPGVGAGRDPASRIQESEGAFGIRNPESRILAPLKIFAGGNLEGRKGVAIALRALEMLGQRGVAFEFVYGGFGPELRHLQKMAAGMNFGSGSVSLGQHFEGAEYRRRLGESDVYLLPSLREGAPVTMIEAMAVGAVPVVADAGGAPMVVDASCGVVIPVTNPTTMAGLIASHLAELAGDRSKLAMLSNAAIQRVRERCMEDTYVAGIEEAYRLAVVGSR